MSAYFAFDEAENLVTERIYFDTLSMFSQLLAGLNLREPDLVLINAHSTYLLNRANKTS